MSDRRQRVDAALAALRSLKEKSEVEEVVYDFVTEKPDIYSRVQTGLAEAFNAIMSDRQEVINELRVVAMLQDSLQRDKRDKDPDAVPGIKARILRALIRTGICGGAPREKEWEAELKKIADDLDIDGLKRLKQYLEGPGRSPPKLF